MGRRKDLKRRQGNRAGTARNRQREAQAGSAGSGGATAAVDPATDKECPRCGAKPGEVCVTPSGNPAAKTHAARG
jgi:hypothetical protein